MEEKGKKKEVVTKTLCRFSSVQCFAADEGYILILIGQTNYFLQFLTIKCTTSTMLNN